jgi:hypothetical protein
VLWADVDLPADDDAGWPTPLKDRDIADTRKVPIYPALIVRRRGHRMGFGDGPARLVSHRNEKPFATNLFARTVGSRPGLPPSASTGFYRWTIPASESSPGCVATTCAMPPTPGGSESSRRRHVPALVGPQDLSVLLNMYQGVARAGRMRNPQTHCLAAGNDPDGGIPD